MHLRAGRLISARSVRADSQGHGGTAWLWPYAPSEIGHVLKDLFARREELEALRAEVADLREEVERMRRSGPAW